MAAATEATILAAVEARLNAVPNKGNVHDYERWVSDWTKYIDNFKAEIGGENVIRGWTITINGIGNSRKMPGSDVEITGQWDKKSVHFKTYPIVIRGYFGLDDAAESEKTARGIAEDVIEELEKYPNLNGTLEVGYYTDGGLPSMVVFEPRSYGGVLCHYIEIHAEVWDAGPVTYSGIY